MITVLANMQINSEQRLSRLKHSFLSFDTIGDNWIINIRGIKRKQAVSFLKRRLKNRGIFFTLLDDDRGWSTNCLTMLKKSKYDHVLLWVEDHTNLQPQSVLKKLLQETIKNKVDFLSITWWIFGYKLQRLANRKISLRRRKYISSVNFDIKSWNKFIDDSYHPYLIPMQGVFKKNLLVKLLCQDQLKWPLKLTGMVFMLAKLIKYFSPKTDPQVFFQQINRLLGYHLPLYPKQTPYNVELDYSRIDILPLKYAFPNREMFASIDDDGFVEDYSLIHRGLYPPRKHKPKLSTKK